ncbi:DUF7281 domain-containing protein [Colwellia sp. 12G3]|uniref:DUF7281 domain-containing protein n=1 Tax=Colwellia sp. 12G3 TaxID=2058299 RepID=UPI000C34C512|nr:hypothetical protein [Colwellia sp. 12G3]PKI16225.1 hypothetical protein CXF71_11340 [Colwellia sp. 12G3]
MKVTINKQLYNFTQDKLQKHRQGGQIKNSSLATKLYEEYNFGQFDVNKQWLTFSLDNILALSEEINGVLGLDIRQDPYPTSEDRLTTSEKSRNEKANSYAVSKEFVLINSLSEVKINQSCYKISPLTSLGAYIKAEEIQSIEHSAVVLVENLAVMANLSSINLTSIDNTLDLTQALWLYRGDVKAQQTTTTSYQFFRHFKGNIPLICFSDLDPKGIEIALTSHADFWLTLKNTNDVTMPLLGNEQEWYKQSASVSYLSDKMKKYISQETENVCWQGVFNTLLNHRKTLKQEHMLKHKLALTLISLKE